MFFQSDDRESKPFNTDQADLSKVSMFMFIDREVTMAIV